MEELSLDLLPEEVILDIFSFLDSPALYRLSFTATNWRAYLFPEAENDKMSEFIWKQCILNHFGPLKKNNKQTWRSICQQYTSPKDQGFLRKANPRRVSRPLRRARRG
eukprot:TRINITY_DN7162_c0_g1_i1.p1 TRINITY_DN7162_c0_g1~~TRINITY_DN7162_c0_g1_i1.p1  ORF type:complete len:108 (-),score=0.53 TRINITY_DN7162_c0_g1_i1:27-350(-)